MTVTIACPLGLSHDAINTDTAPIWVDAAGNQYRVASGVIDGCEATEHQTATPSAVTILIGPPGLAALAAMGLTPPAETA
jgi:hypothetical protein